MLQLGVLQTSVHLVFAVVIFIIIIPVFMLQLGVLQTSVRLVSAVVSNSLTLAVASYAHLAPRILSPPSHKTSLPGADDSGLPHRDGDSHKQSTVATPVTGISHGTKIINDHSRHFFLI
jgi:hypothetical protein